MLHHFAHQAIDGRWHTVYRVPGCPVLHSVGEGSCKAMATAEADRLNAAQERQHAAAMAVSGDRCERPIPAGFYTDQDAA